MHVRANVACARVPRRRGGDEDGHAGRPFTMGRCLALPQGAQRDARLPGVPQVSDDGSMKTARRGFLGAAVGDPRRRAGRRLLEAASPLPDPARRPARRRHAGHRAPLPDDLPRVPRRLRRDSARARGTRGQAGGQPRAPAQPRRAVPARPGGDRGALLAGSARHAARGDRADRRGTRPSSALAAGLQQALDAQEAGRRAHPPGAGKHRRALSHLAHGAGAGAEPGRHLRPDGSRPGFARAPTRAFGIDATPVPDIAAAKLLLSIGDDFVEEGAVVEHARALADLRPPAGGSSTSARGCRSRRPPPTSGCRSCPGPEIILVLGLARRVLELVGSRRRPRGWRRHTREPARAL